MDFARIVSLCEDIVVLCDLSQTSEYDVNSDYRQKVYSMLRSKVKEIYDMFD